MLYHITKRSFCIVASFLGIVFTMPLWTIAMLGILLSDPGPVFYEAHRVGKHNKNFKMYKFRSMRIDRTADESSFKADTKRIFPFGAFLRATKIDELPQLINCFIGDMAIIGPRPASIDQVAIVRAGKYAVVSNVKPGLSGPSALYDYIYGDTVEDPVEYENLVLPTRLELDRYYVNNASLFFDAKMIWWTVLSIFYSFAGKDNQTRTDILEELKSYVQN